jgi:penicillin-insensitive murein endopeptidase
MLVAVKAAALWSILLAAAAGPPAPAAPKQGIVAKQWQAQRKPSAGPALSIGTTSLGCLQGAATLPASGPGYEVVRLGRNRRYGHPNLIAYLQRLGAGARQAKLGLVIVGDLSQPRGGPTPSGHRSHQTGLDADIGYAAPAGVRARHLSRRAREQLSPLAVIDLKTHEDDARLDAGGREAAGAGRRGSGGGSDLRQPRGQEDAVRGSRDSDGAVAGAPAPVVGPPRSLPRAAEMPGRQPAVRAAEAPRDNGCGATLAWWFSDHATEARTKKKEAEAAAPEPTLPAACAVLVQTKC